MSADQKKSKKQQSIKDKIKSKKTRKTMDQEDYEAYLNSLTEVSSTVETIKSFMSNEEETENKPKKKTPKKKPEVNAFFDKEPETLKIGIRVERELSDFIRERLGPRGYTKFYKKAGELLRDEILKAEKGGHNE